MATDTCLDEFFGNATKYSWTEQTVSIFYLFISLFIGSFLFDILMNSVDLPVQKASQKASTVFLAYW